MGVLGNVGLGEGLEDGIGDPGEEGLDGARELIGNHRGACFVALAALVDPEMN